MKVSYNWLKDYLSFDLEPEALSKVLTSIGLEVEAMEMVEQIPGGLAGVFVGEVKECGKHPDADKLSLTKVDIGSGELLQIVCGAPNVAAGQKVLVVTVGSTLYTKEGEEFKIKRSKIRGVESFGMICAEDELGLGDDHDGIMVLANDAVIGTPAKDYLKLESDIVFEIGLTPNRIDAASHWGVARDLYAYLQLNGMKGELKLPDVSDFTEDNGESIPIEILSPEGAPRYMGITLTGIKVGESPEWLKRKLIAIGLRPINNIVDITNFVLHETGQPLHAFDASKIEGSKVVVREAMEGEKFITLDGVERELSKGDLMICSIEKPMCLAGVFGGINSGVTQETTSVFLESAYFNPTYIRKSSKRHGLKTDASFRYERGVDPDMVPYAAKRAVLLMQELAGAKVVGRVREFYPEKIEKKKVSLDFDRMRRFIGKNIDNETFELILRALDFNIVTLGESSAEVVVPPYRVDVYRECDVVEDILRIYGYNNIPFPEQMSISVNNSQHPDPERVKDQASDLLTFNGFMECMNNSLTKADYYNGLTTYSKDNLVMIMNPLSSDLNAMRQTLILNGLEVIEYNINRQATNLKLFELGNVYSYFPVTDQEQNNPSENLKSYRESMNMAIFISSQGRQYWRNRDEKGDFYQLKGYLELLMKRFGIDLNSFESDAAPTDLFSEGMTYKRGDKWLAMIGTVSKSLLKQFGIKQPVYAAEINWSELMKLYRKNRVFYRELPKFPEVNRDLALLLDESVAYSDLRKLVYAIEKRVLKNVTLFDVYRGDKIPEGKKQYAISFTFQDPDKTLTDQYVDQIVAKLLKQFEEKFGAKLR